MDIKTKIIIDRLLEDKTLVNEIKRYFIAADFFAWNQSPETQKKIANNCVDTILKKMTESGYEIEGEVVRKELRRFFYMSTLSGIEKTDISFFSKLIEIANPIRTAPASHIAFKYFLLRERMTYSGILNIGSFEKKEKNKIQSKVEENQNKILDCFVNDADIDNEYKFAKKFTIIASFITLMSTLIAGIVTLNILTTFLVLILTPIILIFTFSITDRIFLSSRLKNGINKSVTLDLESFELEQSKKKPSKKLVTNWQTLIQEKQPVSTNSPDEQTTVISETNEENSFLFNLNNPPSEIILTINTEPSEKVDEPEPVKKPKRKHLNSREAEEKLPNQPVKMDLSIPAPSTFGSRFENLDPKYFVRMTGYGLNDNSSLYAIWNDVQIKTNVDFKSGAQIDAYNRLFNIFSQGKTAAPRDDNGIKYLKDLGLFAVKDTKKDARVYGAMERYADQSFINFYLFSKSGMKH
ncbi:MAG: hypothetical protein JSS53_09875 [Proteobacteria bacterium]|nr:hypothetical protein [Pseudomonadota bacterium]